jgi:hypothetical protein
LPRHWQERPGTRRLPVLESIENKLPPVRRANRQRMRQRSNADPIFWLASQRRTRGLFWTATLVASGVLAITFLAGGGFGAGLVVLLPFALAFHFGLAIWIAVLSSYSLAEARRSGLLDLLASTPLTDREISDGYAKAIEETFFWPVVTLMSLEMLLLLGQFYIWRMANPASASGFEWLTIAGLTLGVVLMDFYTVLWFGLWAGLTCRRPSVAAARTVLLVLVLPLVTLCLWPATSFIKDLFFLHYAQNNLRTRLRQTLAQELISAPDTGLLLPIPAREVRSRLPPLIGG